MLNDECAIDTSVDMNFPQADRNITIVVAVVDDGAGVCVVVPHHVCLPF